MERETLRAAVVGLGKIGMLYDLEEGRVFPSTHVSAYAQNENIQLVAAADPIMERRQLFFQRSPSSHYYESLEQMLSHEEIHILSICTPPQDRLPMIEQILEHPSLKLVFCEKPIALSTEDALKIQRMVKKSAVTFIPNLSRRWSSSLRECREAIEDHIYGNLVRLNIKYTRGIFNTGAHLFDLVSYLAGPINQVQVFEKVATSADYDQDPSYSFLFWLENEVPGIAEAFNDQDYYMFEMDLYFTAGKISIQLSGDRLQYWVVRDHPVFWQFKSLELDRLKQNLLRESFIANSIQHLVDVVNQHSQPICTIDDGIRPVFIAAALAKSYETGGTKQKVVMEHV